MTADHKVSAPRLASSLVGLLTLIGGLVLVGMVLAAVAVLLPGNKLCLNRGGGFYGNFAPQQGIPYAEGQPVCHLGTSMTLAAIGIQVLWPLFSFVALLLLFRLLRTASRQGPFHAAVPTRMRTLGVFVAIGGPLTAVAASLLTNSILFHEPLSAMSPWSWGQDNLWGFPWIAITGIGVYPWFILLVGLGTITFASIMRAGVRMREDLEGTI
jgi:hypothetical protein